VPAYRGHVARRSEETRALLIRTALELFADRGLDNVSLREIGVAARQGNNAVVHYYFGDRDGLFKAIVAELTTTNATLAADPRHLLPEGEASPRDLAAALVLPLASMLEAHGLYLEFIAAVMVDVDRAQLLLSEPAARWFRDVADRMERDLGIDQADHRFAFAVTLTVHALADRARMQRVSDAYDHDDRFVAELVDAVTAVLGGEQDPPRRAAAERRR
jgi:AcrR family transcriptional regulator